MNRRHDIDALRAIAFSFLILYHVAMLYVADWDWHLKSSYTTTLLQGPMILLNRWRMDLIFAISGVATFFMMRKLSPGTFLRQRLWRLLLPLAFGIVVVVPIQPYCQGVANGLVEPGFAKFLVHYFTGYKWPRDAFDGWQYGFTYNHLWYLPYLLAYTLVLAAVRPLAARVQFALTGWRLLVFPAVPLALYAIFLNRFPATHAFVDDWQNHATYFTVFLYGWWMAASDTVWVELSRLRKGSLAAAVAAYVAYAILRTDDIDKLAPGLLPLILAVRSLYVWLAIATIFGWGHALLNRPFKWLPFATEAVYPWYILHQSLIVIIAYCLVPMKLGAAVEVTLVLAGTIGGCALLHVFVIRRVRWLRPCFGMQPLKDRPSVPAGAAAA